MGVYKEVKNIFVNKEEKKVYIDAWKTKGNNNEEGEVIAKVDFNGKVGYLNEAAKTDELAQEIIKDTQYNVLSDKAYELYKIDWCSQRNYKINDVDEESGFAGELYVCLDEFKDVEFKDEEYIKYLLNDEDFRLWKTLT